MLPDDDPEDFYCSPRRTTKKHCTIYAILQPPFCKKKFI